MGAGTPPLSLYSAINTFALLGNKNISVDSNIINYHQTSGFINEEASLFFQKNENVQVEPSNILITNGVQEGISLAISCFKDKVFFPVLTWT